MKSVSMAEKTLSGRGSFTRGVATMKKVTFLKALVAVLVLGIAVLAAPVFGRSGVKFGGFIEVNAGINDKIRPVMYENYFNKGAVSYIAANGNLANIDDVSDIVVLDQQYFNKNSFVDEFNRKKTELSGGWYIASGTIRVDHQIELLGDVNIILEDGCDFKIASNAALLYAIKGDKYKLTIYSQSIDSYDLTANSTERKMGILSAAGDQVGISVAELVINGGYVTGWDGNEKNSRAGVEAKEITINDGKILFSGGYGAIIYNKLTVNGGWVKFWTGANMRSAVNTSICGNGNTPLDFYLNGGQVNTYGMSGNIGTFYVDYKKAEDYIIFQEYPEVQRSFVVTPNKDYLLSNGYGGYKTISSQDHTPQNIKVSYSTLMLTRTYYNLTVVFDENIVRIMRVPSGSVINDYVKYPEDFPKGYRDNNGNWYFIFEGNVEKRYGDFRIDYDMTIYYNNPRKNVNDCYLEVSDLIYNGEGQDPLVRDGDNNILRLGLDYTIRYFLEKEKGREEVTKPKEPGTYLATISGRGMYSHTTDPMKVFKVLKRDLDVSGITAVDKEYDGTDTVTLKFDNVSFTGIVNGDSFSVTAEGAFEDVSVGENKKVNISNIVLSGDHADYYIPVVSQDVTANITKRKISITTADQKLAANGKLDNGTDKYSITSGSLLAGHSYSVVLAPGLTESGEESGTIIIDSIAIKNGEEDVTDNYEVTCIPGKLSFDKVPATMTPPAAKSLTYNGMFQELVTAGLSNDGDVLYALGQNASTAPTSGFSDKIPTGKNAGTYYVWYMLKGDLRHEDIAPKCVPVYIARCSITITAMDQKGKKGDDIVLLTYTVSGNTVSGDDLKITLSTSATKNSPAGEYQIIVYYNSGDNYNVNAVSGKYIIEDVEPTNIPTQKPTADPTPDPTPEPEKDPTPDPSGEPTPEPSQDPGKDPTPAPTKDPSPTPSGNPTPEPSQDPGKDPTPKPTTDPTPIPSQSPNPLDPDDYGNVVDTTTTEDEKGNVNTHTVTEYSDGNVRETDVTEKKNGDIIEKDVVSDSEGNVIQTSVETVTTSKKGTETSEKTVVNNDGSQEQSSRTETTTGKVTEKYYTLDATGTGIYTVNTTTASGGQKTIIYDLNSSGEATLVSFETTGKKAKIPDEITVGDKKYRVVKNEQSLVTTKAGTRKGIIRIVAEMSFIRDITFKVEINFDKVPSKKAMKVWKLTLKNAKSVKVYITASTKKKYKSLKKSFTTRLKQIKADTKKFKFKRIKSN